MIDYTGQQVGSYRLVRRLGIGGFASVYQGQHVRISTQQAAIKILHLSDVDTKKFQQEAETTAALVHPNIIRLFDFDVSDTTPFLTPISRRTLLVIGASASVAVLGGSFYWFTTSYYGKGIALPGVTPTPLGTLLFIYRGHSSIVTSVAWSPDGKRIASSSTDSTVQVWNADGSGFPLTYKGHGDAVTSVAWSPDGKRIAFASSDKTVQVWRVG